MSTHASHARVRWQHTRVVGRAQKRWLLAATVAVVSCARRNRGDDTHACGRAHDGRTVRSKKTHKQTGVSSGPSRVSFCSQRYRGALAVSELPAVRR
eukprot:3241275-Pleurochrysis_carterae.AAC.2